MGGHGFGWVKTVLAAAAVVLAAGGAALSGEKAEPAAKPESVLATALKLLPAAPADSPKEPILKAGDKIVAIGDSITAAGGYLEMIDAALAQGCPDLRIPLVVNAGIGGQQAEDLVGRFEADVVGKKPAVATISIGINDVWQRLDQPADPRVLKAYRENVARMVDRAQAAGIKVILLAPTVIGEDPEAEGNQRLADYAAAMKAVAAEKKCGFADLHGLFLEAFRKKPVGIKGQRWLTWDDVHMNPLGDAIMAVGILRALGLSDEKIAAAGRVGADDHGESLKKAVEAFHNGLASPKKEERQGALQAMLPGKQDLVALFGDKGEKLWEHLERYHQELLARIDQLAEEVADGGPIEGIKVESVRSRARHFESYREVLAMLPKDQPVYSITLLYKGKGASGSSAYLLVNGRWVFIRRLDYIPKVLKGDK